MVLGITVKGPYAGMQDGLNTQTQDQTNKQTIWKYLSVTISHIKNINDFVLGMFWFRFVLMRMGMQPKYRTPDKTNKQTIWT